ncbi:MAG: DNA repair protein RadC [Fimbriimonadales bacterium]|nr:DNA repair protein RadC [Fimbriimonadales bacterium]
MNFGHTNAFLRVTQSGVAAAAIHDLLALGLARREEDLQLAEQEARNLVGAGTSWVRVRDLSPAELKGQGMSTFESWRCLAWMEIGRRLAEANRGVSASIDGPEDVAELFKHLRSEKKEHFGVVLLDAKNTVLRTTIVHVGSLTASIVSPREVFREAIREGAASIIAVHNHPSGDPTPSREDVSVTRQLAQVGRLLDIPLLDHVILGDGALPEREFVSLQRQGVIGA